jgi:hypothetical protein
MNIKGARFLVRFGPARLTCAYEVDFDVYNHGRKRLSCYKPISIEVFACIVKTPQELRDRLIPEFSRLRRRAWRTALKPAHQCRCTNRWSAKIKNILLRRSLLRLHQMISMLQPKNTSEERPSVVETPLAQGPASSRGKERLKRA